MEVDADDRVSARLVEHVRCESNGVGYIVEHGYILEKSSGRIAPFPLEGVGIASFDAFCGTCAVLHFEPADMRPDASGADCRVKRIKGRGHQRIRDALIAEQRPAGRFPFPAAVYVINTGNNISHRPDTRDQGKMATFRASLAETIKREGSPITPELEAEFCLTCAP